MSRVFFFNDTATTEIYTRFHRGASEGTLSAEATVIKAGRRVIQLEARTTDDRDRLVATAPASFAVIDPRPEHQS